MSFTVLLDNYIAASAQMAANRRILSPDVNKQQVGRAPGISLKHAIHGQRG